MKVSSSFPLIAPLWFYSKAVNLCTGAATHSILALTFEAVIRMSLLSNTSLLFRGHMRCLSPHTAGITNSDTKKYHLCFFIIRISPQVYKALSLGKSPSIHKIYFILNLKLVHIFSLWKLLFLANGCAFPFPGSFHTWFLPASLSFKPASTTVTILQVVGCPGSILPASPDGLLPTPTPSHRENRCHCGHRWEGRGRLAE